MKTNIPLEEQVVSLEVAKELDKKLNGAGIEFEAHYFWRTFDMYNLKTDKAADCFRLLQKGEESHAMMATQLDEAGNATWHFGKNVIDYPAPTLTEMLHLLPARISYFGDLAIYTICKGIGYADEDRDLDRESTVYYDDFILPTAAAKLWIWLYDNGYIKL